ncbi:unnamed protein product, partial [Cuscuta campestris]
MNHLNSFGSSTCEILKLGRPKELGLVNLRPSAAGRVNPEKETELMGRYGAGKRGSRPWRDRLHRGRTAPPEAGTPPITTGEAEALIQRVGITAEQFKEVLAALAPNREVVVGDVARGPTGEKAGPAGSQGKKKKVRRSQKKKATKPNGKAMMADALSRLEEEDESSSFERMSAFDRLGDPKSKKPRTSAFERLQDTRSARKGDLRDTLKKKRGESTATSKAVFSEVTPFSRRIMSCPLPDNFKTPQIKAYNGTTDPQDHLARFGANVVMYAYPEEIKCRCFLATLEGQACEWFHKLPKGSIDKWGDLAHKFLEHFASSRRQKLPFSHLLNVKIRKGEQLREFINRWEKEARDVQGADDQALIAMLGESTATSKVGSEERRTTVGDKGAAELWKMYEQLEKRLDAQNPYRQAVFSEVTPFSRRIMSCPLPDNFKTPQIKAYNGTTDPQDHLARFGANVVMYAYPEEIKCRCFLATLEGQACEWFHKLPKGSIDKWGDLAHKFLEHFASSRRQKLPFSHLLNVKIRKGEQLREFINRWEKEARDVQGADDQALIAMLQAALPQGDVRKELRRNPLSAYQEMLARAKYLALEEEDDEPPVRKEKKSRPPVAKGKKRKDYGKGPNPTGYHANRHPVHAVQSFPAPPHGRESYGVQDAPKYCEYHRNSTHNMSECVTLKKEMDQLIARGPPPRSERPSTSNRTWRRPPAPTAAITAEEGQEDGRRHLGRDCDDLDEKERQGRRHLGCRSPLPKRKKKEPLIFDEDYPPVLSPHRDALVIRVEINNVVVHRTLVDTGSSVNVMYSNTFKELGLPRSDLKPIHTPLSGFTGDTIEAEGTITVKAGVGDGTHRLWVDMEFMVVQLDCAHHLILGRPGLEDLECVISPVHLCLKFNTPTGVGVAKGNQSLSRSCYVRATKSQARVDENVSTICAAIQKEEGRPRAEPAEEVEEVSLDPVEPERKLKVGKTLPLELKEQLLEVLRAFKVLFAWGQEDMPGVDPKIICHRLAVDPTHKPVKQKKRFLSAERREFVTKQVTTLQSIGHIREVRYPE